MRAVGLKRMVNGELGAEVDVSCLRGLIRRRTRSKLAP